MSFYKIAKKLNQVFNLYKFAVSSTYDVLGTERTVDSISKLILKYLESNPDVNPVEFQLKFAKLAQDKFNKLIVPYLKISFVNLNLQELKQRLIKKTNQDDLQFFLHDLLHEILKPGSISEFSKLDKEFEERQEETLNLMKEDSDFEDCWQEEEEGDEYFEGEPRYESSHEVYSLEDYIEEQVAEALTNKDKITDNGLIRYFNGIFISTLNDRFGTHYSFRAWDLDMIWDNIDDFLDLIKNKIETDVAMISNPKYKNLGRKFLQSFTNWVKEFEDKYRDEDEFNPIIIFNSLNGKIKNWIGANFNIKQKKFDYQIKDDSDSKYKENPLGEKAIADLTDDFKMSLARRWVLSLELLAKEMISNQYSKQLKLF